MKLLRWLARHAGCGLCDILAGRVAEQDILIASLRREVEVWREHADAAHMSLLGQMVPGNFPHSTTRSGEA